MIISKSNQKVKEIRQLLEQSKARKSSGKFVVEGVRICREVPAELLDCAYISESILNDGFNTSVFGGRIEVISDDVFKAVSDTVNPQGILAVVKQPSYSFDEVKEGSLFAILDDVRDPGNVGTIVRTAEAAGANVILSSGCADLFNPKVIRATMGSIFRVPFFKSEDLCSTIEKLKAEGVSVYGAALDGSVSFDQVDRSGRRAYVIGNEANGVSEEVLESCSGKVFIPMQGQVESLNAAISAAILLYI